MSPLHLHLAADPTSLAGGLAAAASVSADPFARPLLLVPGPGPQRWLSQQIARRSAADGEGIMAGFDVHPLHRLERLLTTAGHDDAWHPARLVWSVLAVADDGDPGLQPLVTHLRANDQRYANALRVARLLAHYADHRPAMLAAWADDPDAAASDLGFDGWQVRLWQALGRRLTAPDPVRRRAALARAVASGEHPVPWPSVHVFAPRSTTAVQRALLAAMAHQIDVDVWLPTAGPDPTANPVGTALGRRARGWQAAWQTIADEVSVHDAAPRADTETTATTQGSALTRLQAAIHAGVRLPAVGDDGSITLHASHAAGRQVEVLREALVGAFADDPTLEPRDVVIATPDPRALAPHLTAAFTAAAQATAGIRRAHPGTQLRVQVGDGTVEGNQLFTLLRSLLQLGATRAGATQLLALAGHPFVARRFGFDHDDLERLEELVDAAAIRWGINGEHRACFGLEDIPQNTWQLGVQRLVMGEAFSDDRLVSAGIVATVDDVTSTDTTLIGALAEFVSRVSRFVRVSATPGTVPEWVTRLREAVAMLTDVPFDDGWQLAQTWAVLETLEARGADSPTLLQPADALALLGDAFSDAGTRPAFGNGSLVVCSLDALARVPHRVVCLVGLDERTFPRRGLGDGDDLLARDPAPDDPDPGSDDRQALLDAVLAAGERLIVVYQGQSSLSPEPHHPPAPVQELIEAVGADAVRREPLQPFAPAAFGAPGPSGATVTQSFDAGALAGARAVVGPRRPAPERHAVAGLQRGAPLTEVALERLTAMLRHPGRFLLKERAELTLGDDAPLAESIPVEVDHMTRWRIGDAMLTDLAAGHSPDAVITHAWLSGDLPPRALGASAIAEVAEQAGAVHTRLLREADAPPQTHAIDLDVEGVAVTGRLVTRAGLLAESHYGSVQAKHLAAAWVRMLALTVALDRRTDAVLVGGRGTHRLVAPPVDLARGFLADLVDLAGHATHEVLPLPPRVAEFWARERARGRDPLARRDELAKLWSFDSDEVWKLWWSKENPPWAQARTGDDPWGEPDEKSVLGALAMRVHAPIVRARQA